MGLSLVKGIRHESAICDIAWWMEIENLAAEKIVALRIDGKHQQDRNKPITLNNGYKQCKGDNKTNPANLKDMKR